MHVYVDGGLAYVWPCRPRGGATGRRPATTPSSAWPECGIPANTTCRRCPTRCSSTAATPSTARGRSGSLDGRRAMAACACIRLMRARCPGWWDITAAPVSSSGRDLNMPAAAPCWPHDPALASQGFRHPRSLCSAAPPTQARTSRTPNFMSQPSASLTAGRSSTRSCARSADPVADRKERHQGGGPAESRDVPRRPRAVARTWLRQPRTTV